MSLERFQKQMDFILEIDKAKNIFRQTYLADGKRKENDAEHSWHLAMMAFVLSEYFPKADVCRVMKMVLMHDLVEIYAGDTYCYDTAANMDKAERETAAAEKIYGLLPQDMEKEYREIWQEFEDRKTEEARFANMLDRLQPIMLNFASDGAAWREHSVHTSQVMGRNSLIMSEGPEEMRDYFLDIIRRAEERGYLIRE